jgi:hypothetical protein
MTVAIDDISGDQSDLMRQNIDQVISDLNAALVPYGVTLVGVNTADAIDANVHLQVAETTEFGGAAEGVLGLAQAGGQITLVSGWNYYYGDSSTAIAADQYDFRTVVAHELLHAVGLGHSIDEASVMYAYLGTAELRRTLSDADFALISAEQQAEAETTEPEFLLAKPFIFTVSAATPLPTTDSSVVTLGSSLEFVVLSTDVGFASNRVADQGNPTSVLLPLIGRSTGEPTLSTKLLRQSSIDDLLFGDLAGTKGRRRSTSTSGEQSLSGKAEFDVVLDALLADHLSLPTGESLSPVADAVTRDTSANHVGTARVASASELVAYRSQQEAIASIDEVMAEVAQQPVSEAPPAAGQAANEAEAS